MHGRAGSDAYPNGRDGAGIDAFVEMFRAPVDGASQLQGCGNGEAASSVERARALRARAGFELTISPERASRTLSHARTLARSTETPEDCHRQRLLETLVRCHALDDVSLHEIEDLLGADGGRRRTAPVVSERRLFTSWLLATGKTARAQAWAELDARRTDLEPDDWRARQAELTEEQLRAAHGRLPSVRIESCMPPEASASPVGWFRTLIEFYWHLIEGNTAAARRRAEAIVALHSLIPEGLRGDGPTLAAICTAVEGGGDIKLPLPVRLSLTTAGSALIAGEAVALGGSREDAAEWYAWFETSWPSHVLRGPRWPVLAPRVRGLLAARAGDLDAAMRWMADAIEVADRIDSPVEAALARVQYAELLALDPRRESRERWCDLVQEGTERCRTLGIPHEHHAYRARTAAALGRFDLFSDETESAAAIPTALTAREIEVLRLFRAGLSYRQAAEVLDVGWRTVQSHAYNAYQKLGASSKIAAVTAASRLHLL